MRNLCTCSARTRGRSTSGQCSKLGTPSVQEVALQVRPEAPCLPGCGRPGMLGEVPLIHQDEGPDFVAAGSGLHAARYMEL